MNSIEPTSPESPFDGLMGEDGRWSARDLQGLMGYSRWENMSPAIERAKVSAKNQGMVVEEHFLGSQENPSEQGGRPRKDYRLSRMAAYLVAMNGDPNKPEVAAAQAYFATKTREAEVGIPRELTRKELALAVIAAEEEKERIALEAARLSEELSVAAPKADKWQQYMNSDGLIGMTELAAILGISAVALTKKLVEKEIFRVLEREGKRSRTPRAKYLHNGMFETKIEVHNGHTVHVNYAHPSGADHVMDIFQHPLARIGK